MKVILITGLDGSGKSSLLKKLEEFSGTGQVRFLRVPKIDAGLFQSDPALYQTALFVNKLHVEADHLKLPEIKSVALFSAMLLFRKLLGAISNDQVEYVFCERHPLIDTSVYVRFYQHKMDPSRLPENVRTYFGRGHESELEMICGLLPEKINDISLTGLLAYMHEEFAIKKRYTGEDLQRIFKLAAPEKIYYLSAEPVILMQRLSERHTLEAHESVEVFSKLKPVYESILKDCGTDTEIIDANHFGNIDAAFEKMKAEYLSR